MRKSLTLTAVFALATAAGCTSSNNTGSIASDATITVHNASTHVLTEVRVAQINQVDWGPNLLPDVLFPDESLTVAVTCNTYDVLVSDDHGRSCVLGNLDLCFTDNTWDIDNAGLRSCGF